MSANALQGSQSSSGAASNARSTASAIAIIDQLELTGHARRMDDLGRYRGARDSQSCAIQSVGAVAPRGVRRADWAGLMRGLPSSGHSGSRPIAGLVHHGSGPRYTTLLDSGFPERLAEYAGAVARRYPWIQATRPSMSR